MSATTGSTSSSVQLPAYKGFTVRVSILVAGKAVAPTTMMIQSPIAGHDVMDIPAYSFLVENDTAGEKVLYDLGFMKAWKEKLPPLIVEQVQSSGITIDIPSDVADMLNSASVPLSSVDSIIWSHHHVDHMGDPSLFPSSTSLIVGPGFKSNPKTYPGYPDNPDALTNQDAFEGRHLIELDFSKSQLKVCGLRAIDWFDDGSFYLLEAPGHTDDHVMALARTAEEKFILLGGDTAHHCGEFRPTPLLPLPSSIFPSPFGPPTASGQSLSSCPGSIFEPIHRSAADPESDFRTTPFYEAAPAMQTDAVASRVTLEALKMLDASPDVLVVIAHDPSLLDILEFSPYLKAELTGWEEGGERNTKGIGRWRFLKDFGKQVVVPV